MFTTEKREKTGMLYIFKLLIVCLLLKYGKKRDVLHIKTSMFTPEIQKNGILHMLKLVCLLQKKGKNGHVVHIKTSMFTTEIREKRVCCKY